MQLSQQYAEYKSTLPVILYFIQFFVAQTSITRFFVAFSKVEKLNIYVIYKSIIIIFSVSFGIYLQVFFKEIQIQPPGEYIFWDMEPAALIVYSPVK